MTRREGLAGAAGLVGTAGLAGAAAAAPAASYKDGERRPFMIENLRLESGAVLPRAVVMHATWGRLNAAGDNAVLLPSHYMADARGYNWLIGPDKALDPAKYFLVATELFGNGKSSSPSNTPEPFHGPRFPVPTIRDNVEVCRRLLAELYGVKRLKAVIGFSMGGQQAFQWAVSHPTFAERIVVTSATAKTWPHGIVRLESLYTAIKTDPAFNDGNYTQEPAAGISAFGMVWAPWLFGQEWWRLGLWKEAGMGNTLAEAIDHFRTSFIPGADANNLILQMRTWETHDVGTTPGFNGDVQAALRSIKAPLLYMPSETDLYFPVEDARYESQFIPGVTLKPIPSVWGHTAGAASNPADARFLNTEIGRFMGQAA